VSLEANTVEYLKSFIEPEALQKSAKINKHFVPIEEKYECLTYLIKNYRMIDSEIIRSAIISFREALTRLGAKYTKFKMDGFEDLLKIIKHYTDHTSDYLYYIMEVFFIFLTEEPKNLERAYELDLLKYFYNMSRKPDLRTATKACSLKVCAYLCKLDDFLNLVIRNGIMGSVAGFAIPLIVGYCNDSTNIVSEGGEYIISLEDTESKHREEDITTEVSEVDGMSRPTAIVYYSISMLWELFRKEKNFKESSPQKMVDALFKLLNKQKLPKPLRNIILHTLLRISYFENYR